MLVHILWEWKKKEEKICITRYDIIERETYRKIKDINEIFKIDVCPNIIIPPSNQHGSTSNLEDLLDEYETYW